jgi:23S rRNA (uracil-5-)-methyltransferase RumA
VKELNKGNGIKTELKIEQGQQFPLTIKRMGIDGEGVGFFKRQVVFVPGALPGEEVVVEATKVSLKFATAKIVKHRKRSLDRTTPPCPVYNECGGCQIQHITYEGQLREKKDIVRQAFERYTKIDLNKIAFHDTIGMEEPINYRNKSQMQVGKRDGKVIAGLYSTNSHQLIDISDCMVQHPQTNKVTQVVKKIVEDLNIPTYNMKKHKGFLRTIVTRVGFNTNEWQVALVTATKEFPQKEAFLEELTKRLPDVTSVVQNINSEKTPLVFGDETIVLYGKEKMEEKLGEFTFHLSARAFFQLNPIQTVKLYNVAKEAAELTGEENVVDAYCGVGSIGLWVADKAKEIRGMDVVPESIEDANKNAANHNIDHAVFEVGKAENWLPTWEKQGWKTDVVMVDPPRSGLDPSLIETLIRTKPKRIVYVSCNPSTLAKNVADLVNGGYKLKSLQPVDMFPQTSHIETVALIEFK